MSYLRAVTPLNIAEEKEKFFATSNYSPQFIYAWDEESMQAYKKAAPRMSRLFDALVNQDTAAMLNEASTLFDVAFRPQDRILAEALTKDTPPTTNGTAAEFATAIERKLAEFGIDYRVEVVDRHGFQCRPDHKVRVARVSKYLHFQFLSVEGAAKHELVHIIRAVNGKHNGIVPAPDYLPAEEGLASLMQDDLFAQPSGSAYQHALEYLAADLSRTAGFRDVYDFLIEHGCDPQNAWLRGIRQKFGVRDTSQPGGLVKSGMYFYHEQLLRELPQDQLLRLFVGKIPQSALQNYPRYEGVVPREQLLTLLG